MRKLRHRDKPFLMLVIGFSGIIGLSADADQNTQAATARAKAITMLFSGSRGAIDRALASSQGDLVLEPHPTTSPEPRFSDAKDYLLTNSCLADSVVIADLIGGVSEETLMSTTVYTTWSLRVIDVLKSSSSGSIFYGAKMEAIAEGGTILRTGGRRVTVISPLMPDGLEKGGRYIFFLLGIPDINAYQIAALLRVDGEFVQSLPAGRLPLLERIRSEDIRAIARDTAIASIANPLCRRSS